MKKQLLLLSLLGSATSLMAMYAEQAYLYKDSRIMGMGGANVAVGQYSTTLFSNPAGLTNIKKENGFEIDLLSAGFSASSKLTTFAKDFTNATDKQDNEEAILDVLDKYAGEHFHTDFSSYMSISKNSEHFAWSVGLLTAIDLNIMTHGNGSTNNSLLETTSRGYGGLLLGAAKPYSTNYGTVNVGIGLKYIYQKSIEGSIGINDLIQDGSDDSTSDKLKNKYEKESIGVGVDLGVTYEPTGYDNLKPTVGLSILNIGAMKMDNSYGQQPITVNLGAAISPEVKYLKNFVAAIDYVDLFNANKLRIYTYDDRGTTVAYNDYTTSDFLKHLRLGTGAKIIDTKYFSTILNLGLYQSAYTAGLEVNLFILHLNFTTYQEEVGTTDNSYEDRRYMVNLDINW